MAGAGDWSDRWEFTILSAPSVPSLISPIDGTIITNTKDVTFLWNSVSNASSYKIRMTTKGIITGSSTNYTNYTARNLENGTYFWQVAASNNSGDSGWSVPKRFDINIQGDFWFRGDLAGGNSGINVQLWKGSHSKSKWND